MIHQDGTRRDVELVGRPKPSSVRGVGGVIVNVRDVSDRVRAESERAELEERTSRKPARWEAIGHLAGGKSLIDFNNPARRRSLATPSCVRSRSLPA